MVSEIKFQLNSSLFNRDPQDTDLGRRILQHSIILIDEIGIEAFTFRKLAKKIGSTEASVYRYFENKHLLLLFLTNWYWEWVHYLIRVDTKNIDDPRRRLSIIIQDIVSATAENVSTSYINEHLLHRIVIQEGSKAYHTNSVDDENEIGLFLSYKDLVDEVACVIGQINPDFPYRYSLASNLFEMASSQMFFAQHLPRLTDLEGEKNDYGQLKEMLEFFVDRLLA
ncbi:TetR family transcriptional regulator [Lewinellaceae bacterium SD302]|nr:TetR family transcriptional regulator [Lewinellaceae bacterium SD302]